MSDSRVNSLFETEKTREVERKACVAEKHRFERFETSFRVVSEQFMQCSL